MGDTVKINVDGTEYELQDQLVLYNINEAIEVEF